ncbi:MAG: B12-binding domain-containing radical SAM protein [Vulcanimicrobiota bacterium]
MRIALLESSFKNQLGFKFYPMGLGYLASYIRKHISGIEIRVCENLEQVMNYKPDMVGLSVLSSNFPAAEKDCEKIKRELNVPVVLGGAHVSSIPEILPGCFNAGVVGEGEVTFLEIVKLFERQRKLKNHDLLQIDGVVLNIEGKIHLAPRRVLIEDLDNLPYPARDWGVDDHCNWTFTGRGCPYNCAFCFSSLFWDRYRVNSAEYVVGELEELKKYRSIKEHAFWDDLFTVNVKRVRDISSLLNKRIGEKISFTVAARSNLVDVELARAFVELGVEYVHLGLESGSDRVLNFLKVDDCSVETNQKAIDILSSFGIKAIGTFIIGSPTETGEDLEKTYQFINRNLKNGKLFAFCFGPLSPFPGTAIWNYAVSRGIIKPDEFDWTSLNIDISNFNRENYKILSDTSPEKFYYYFEKLNEIMQF